MIYIYSVNYFHIKYLLEYFMFILFVIGVLVIISFFLYILKSQESGASCSADLPNQSVSMGTNQENPKDPKNPRKELPK